MLIPSFLFYHNKQTSKGFAAELDLAPAIISEKTEIIKYLNLHFGELYEFPYNHASVELKNVNYGNNGRVDRMVELTGFPAISRFTLFNAFFSDIYISG